MCFIGLIRSKFVKAARASRNIVPRVCRVHTCTLRTARHELEASTLTHANSRGSSGHASSVSTYELKMSAYDSDMEIG